VASRALLSCTLPPAAATGDIAFCILDPHFTGADELSVIQKKPVKLEGYTVSALLSNKQYSARAARP
jgi:hypothetical protein